MDQKRDKPPEEIFSSPVRKLGADELLKIVGGSGASTNIKGLTGHDNQGKDFDKPPPR